MYISDPKAESNVSTKRANPYAQQPSNGQEGSRPIKVARTEIAQSLPIPPTQQAVQTVPIPRIVEVVPTPQVTQAVPTPQGVQLAARAVPFPFKKREPTNEAQSHAQLATNVNWFTSLSIHLLYLTLHPKASAQL